MRACRREPSLGPPGVRQVNPPPTYRGADVAFQLSGLRQLLQGSPPACSARSGMRATGGRRGGASCARRAGAFGRLFRSSRSAVGAQSGAAYSDTGARRRPSDRRVERDPLLLRGRHRDLPSDRVERGRCSSGCSSSSTATSRTSPCVPVPGATRANRCRLGAGGRRKRSCDSALAAIEKHLAASDLPGRRALHDRRHRALRVHACRPRGRLRARGAFRAVGAWLDQVAAQPGHRPITGLTAREAAKHTQLAPYAPAAGVRALIRSPAPSPRGSRRSVALCPPHPRAQRSARRCRASDRRDRSPRAARARSAHAPSWPG